MDKNGKRDLKTKLNLFNMKAFKMLPHLILQFIYFFYF